MWAIRPCARRPPSVLTAQRCASRCEEPPGVAGDRFELTGIHHDERRRRPVSGLRGLQEVEGKVNMTGAIGRRGDAELAFRRRPRLDPLPALPLGSKSIKQRRGRRLEEPGEGLHGGREIELLDLEGKRLESSTRVVGPRMELAPGALRGGDHKFVHAATPGAPVRALWPCGTRCCAEAWSAPRAAKRLIGVRARTFGRS